MKNTSLFSFLLVFVWLTVCVTTFAVTQPVQDRSDVIINSIGMKLKLIPAGSFVIGTTTYKSGCNTNENKHKVTFTKSFYMGVYEVTQKEYQKVMGANPSKFEGENRPVENITWDEAKAFCLKLSQNDENMLYRLPTQAEWEYSCRAGTKTAFYWGEEFNPLFAWCRINSGRKTQSVGTRRPNDWGLYDMSGNVWEWCEDRFISNANNRVYCGGGYSCNPIACRSNTSGAYFPNTRYSFAGFRVLAVKP